jgi:hypothetical protein
MVMRRLLGVGAVALLLACPALADRWTEADFDAKAKLTRPYNMVASTDPAVADTMIGSVRQYSVVKGDTFLDLARFYGLGYNELEQANPGVDPWGPIRASWSIFRRCGSTTSTRARTASRSG